MVTLNHQDTLYLQRVFEIGGDLLLLPRMRLPNISESMALQKFGIVNADTSLIARNSMMWSMLDAEQAYSRHMEETGEEPSWIDDLSIRLKMWLRYHHAIHNEDPLAINNNFPNTGIWYMIREGGLCEAVERVFGLRRLQWIKQLGFLQQPWVAMADQKIVIPVSNMSRYVHSNDVMTLASVIGHNLGLPERELNTLRVAGLSHDFGLPAGGDSVKLIAPKAFDEDLNYRRLLKKLDEKKWAEVREQFNIDEDALVQTVLNKGLLGQILDVADKLAYVARDIDTVLGVMLDPSDGDAYVGTRALQEIVQEFPYVCSIWDSVKAVDGKLVFTDVWRLIAFLKARVVLFRELYYHPRARFGEYLISRILVKKLYNNGTLTRDQLLQMDDHDLERVLNQAYGQENVTTILSLRSKVRSFKTREEAVAFKQELKRAGNQFALIEDHLHAIKPGTHFLVETPAGPKLLSEAYRGDAQELWEMANMLPAVHVYYLTDDLPEPGTDIGDLLHMAWYPAP